jgi:hypothetical protein
MKGGFILHNSWRAGGHSVEYLYGDQSEENEATICPNHAAPVNWIPATYECVVAEAAAGRIANGSVNCSAYSPEIQRIRGRGIAKNADVLYCHSDDCDRNLTYVLERAGSDVNHTFTASGLAEVQLITVDNRTAPPTVARRSVRGLPFWALSQLLAPVKLVPNDQNNCGYWVLPYETLENMQRINWDLLDNFRVVDLEIEFNESSYVRHPASWDFNTLELNGSTFARNKAKFDGPLPFDLIY